MKNNQLQLVTFEQAQRLKAAGFDWRAPYGYGRGKFGLELGRIYDSQPFAVPAPTVALALKWMRDLKVKSACVEIGASPSYDGGVDYNYEIRIYGEDDYEVFHSNVSFGTYESAESALLDELLTLTEK